MSQRIEFNGEIHEFPDDFTDSDIAKALGAPSDVSNTAPAQPRHGINLAGILSNAGPSAAGGLTGAALGSPFGPLGMILGAGLGGFAGEGANQGYRAMMGGRGGVEPPAPNPLYAMNVAAGQQAGAEGLGQGLVAGANLLAPRMMSYGIRATPKVVTQEAVKAGIGPDEAPDFAALGRTAVNRRVASTGAARKALSKNVKETSRLVGQSVSRGDEARLQELASEMLAGARAAKNRPLTFAETREVMNNARTLANQHLGDISGLKPGRQTRFKANEVQDIKQGAQRAGRAGYNAPMAGQRPINQVDEKRLAQGSRAALNRMAPGTAASDAEAAAMIPVVNAMANRQASEWTTMNPIEGALATAGGFGLHDPRGALLGLLGHPMAARYAALGITNPELQYFLMQQGPRAALYFGSPMFNHEQP